MDAVSWCGGVSLENRFDQALLCIRATSMSA